MMPPIEELSAATSVEVNHDFQSRLAEIPAPPTAPEVYTEEDTIFKVVEDQPRFPGCEGQHLSKEELRSCAEERMLNFIYKHIRYPVQAQQMSVSGTVIIRFVVEMDGSINEIEILRDPGFELGLESKRVVGLFPKWIPGKQRNNPVRVYYNLPIHFKLE